MGITILSRDEILRYVEEEKIVVTPFDSGQVGPTSIDLTLGNEFRVFRKVGQIFHVTEDVSFEEVTDVVAVEDGDYLLVSARSSLILGGNSLPPIVCWSVGLVSTLNM